MSQRRDGSFVSHDDDGTEFHLPENHWPLPALDDVEPEHALASDAEFAAMADDPDYQRLRSTFRGFAFPMTVAGLVSYFVYVLLSIYAIDVMKQPFLGMKGITLGMALGFLQFAVVYVWTYLYVRFANKKIDPLSSQLKARLESATTDRSLA